MKIIAKNGAYRLIDHDGSDAGEIKGATAQDTNLIVHNLMLEGVPIILDNRPAHEKLWDNVHRSNL